MRIPTTRIERFARELIDQCLVSRQSRESQYALCNSYALTGADNTGGAAIFNKTYAYLDDLESLLYSPVSLRYRISNPDYPTVLEEAKGRAAAQRLRNASRKSDTDTRISKAVWGSLIKGKTIIKSSWRGDYSTRLVQPENFGVLHETHETLDEDMEAFTHTMYISHEQFVRLIWNHPDRDALIKKARNYVNVQEGPRDADRQVVTGGMYPLQPADSGTPNRQRGIVDWMGAPQPQMATPVAQKMLRLDELWVWNDEREDWSTLQLIGEDMLILGKYQMVNALAHDTQTGKSTPALKGKHQFTEFCVNPVEDYFWGRSEVLNVALLQESINARINGINRILRKQEDPPKTFIGATGVNQLTQSRYGKPGGYWSDVNPNAKVSITQVELPQDLAGWLHEVERMFDEIGGLPPIARGRGDAGVRSGNHAETLVRMFSPRFKDRALLVERDVEALGALQLDMARAHDSKKLIAWAAPDAIGNQGPTINDPLLVPPSPGLIGVFFTYADLDEDMIVQVDSHSSSPAFASDARALVFDLLKIGAMSPEDVVQHVDVDDPENLIAGIERRALAAQKAQQEALQLKALTHAKK
jgi:hypothetical protein